MEEAVAGACAHAVSDTPHMAARTNPSREDARCIFMMSFAAGDGETRTPTVPSRALTL
jgi:hypothetical protein